MIKNPKRCEIKVVKAQKSTMHRSQSVQVLHSKSKSKTQKTILKSSSTLHESSKFFNSSQSNKVKDKVKKKHSNKKHNSTSSKKKRKLQSGPLKFFNTADNKENLNVSESLNNQQSWREKLKHPILEYFLYRDNYIPIENSAQRRFVQRIKLIDKVSEQQSKNNRAAFQQVKTQIQDQEIMTQIPVLELKESQTEGIQLNNIEIQVTISNRNSSDRSRKMERFVEEPKKCFHTTLTDLEFLFLPDPKNFTAFSEIECDHYKELFITFSEKFNKMMRQRQQDKAQEQAVSDQQIMVMIYQRQCTQMGWTEAYFTEGLPTHIFSILSYVTNLFCYAELKEKSSIIAKMNSVYGYNYVERYLRTSKNKSTKKFLPVLSDSLYIGLQQELFSQHEFSSELLEDSVHGHNRMIFDCVNDLLQEFRPFYQVGGEPFPWNNTIGMTFYSIDQDSLSLLFNQVKDRVIEMSTFLCGMHINYPQKTQSNPNSPKSEKESNWTTKFSDRNPIHVQRIKQQERKMINEEFRKIDDTSHIEEEHVRVLHQLTLLLTEQIMLESATDLQFIRE